jgi:hypothetical protein
MIHIRQLRARVRRLEHLSHGFSCELSLFKTGDDPLNIIERKEYRRCLCETIQAIEAARRALVKACQRLEGT